MASAVDLALLKSFRLGATEIRPGTREVVGPAGREVIEPKVMQVLISLIAAKGEVVTRDQLVRDCWDGRAVSEDAISRVIQRLRRLSESVGAGAFTIRTIHKVGYRLLTPDVEPEKAAIPKAESITGKAGELTRRAAVGLAGAVVVGITAPWILQQDKVGQRVDLLIGQSEQALRAGTAESDQKAVAWLEQAVELRPEHARAWGRLALARTYTAEYARPDEADTALAGVQDAARRALALDDQQVDALSALAILPPYYGDWLAAEKRMNAVLALDPSHLPTRDARSFMLSAVGRERAGSLDRVKMAAADPLHAIYQYRAIYAHWMLGQMGELDRAADRALQLWPKHPGVWFARFHTLALTGRADRALQHVNNADARPALPPWLIDLLRAASTALITRKPADIAIASEGIVGAVSRSPRQSVMAVTLLCGLGEIDRAFEVSDAYLLERGDLIASVRWPRGPKAKSDDRRRKTNMLFLPSASVMRADPRFAVLMQRTGLADYWKAVGVRPDYLA